MATTLGELREFIDGDGITFTIDGETFEHTPSAKVVLDFQDKYRKMVKSPEAQTSRLTWQVAAPLLGGEFDPETGEMHGELLERLVEKGLGFDSLNRLFTSVIMAFWYSEQAAVTYFQTGSVGKALGLTEETEKAVRKSAAKQKAATAPAETKKD